MRRKCEYMGQLVQIIEKIEQAQIAQRNTERKPVPEFRPGDTLRVQVKVVDGNRSRLQAFEGVCIARRGAGWQEKFIVRKLSFGVGVERVFPIYGPTIDSIEVVRHGVVRRAKLYYLRERTGKSARIAERRKSVAPVVAAPVA